MSLKKKRVGEKKKGRGGLGPESFISCLKRSLQGILREIKSKFSRFLSHVIFERLLFCSFALVMFWMKGVPGTQHMSICGTVHLCPLCQVRATPRLQTCFSFSLPGTPSTRALRNPAWQESFPGRQLAQRSCEYAKCWPKVNCHLEQVPLVTGQHPTASHPNTPQRGTRAGNTSVSADTTCSYPSTVSGD